MASVSSALLPARFADAVEGERSFAQARLGAGAGGGGGGGHGGRGQIVCALVPGRGGGGGGGGGREEAESLVVLTGEGHFYQFGVDLVNVRPVPRWYFVCVDACPWGYYRVA